MRSWWIAVGELTENITDKRSNISWREWIYFWIARVIKEVWRVDDIFEIKDTKTSKEKFNSETRILVIGEGLEREKLREILKLKWMEHDGDKLHMKYKHIKRHNNFNK